MALSLKGNQMQKKNSFDKETIKKIARGAGWAVSGPIGTAAIILATKAPQNTWWGVLAAWIIPTGINAIREYRKGQPPTLKMAKTGE